MRSSSESDSDSTSEFTVAPADLPGEVASEELDAVVTGQSRLISRVLSPAIRLWLRSQVEGVETLTFEIEGGDRQILSGHIPRVSIAAQKAVYQGLHLSQVQLVGSGIRVNLGQVLRGKPLRLLHVVPIEGDVCIEEADLNRSLQAPLLAKAVTDFLLSLLQAGVVEMINSTSQESLQFQDLHMMIATGQLTLSANLLSQSEALTPFALRTGLVLASPQRLCLDNPCWLPHAKAKRGLPLQDLHGFEFDLGTDVALQVLALEENRIVCRGSINVIPA